MTSPRRRPIQLDANWDHDLRRLTKAIERDRDPVLLGISALKAELHDAGWPSRTPEDDRRERPPRAHPKADLPTVWQCDTCANQFATWDDFEGHAAEHDDAHQEAIEVATGHGTTGKAHRDPNGDAAMQLWDRHGDLQTIQDHWHAITTSWHAIKLIARRHTPSAEYPKGTGNVEPSCSRPQCDDRVESRVLADGSLSYRGMVCIDGVWVARPGEEPSCPRHRKANERDRVA